MNSGASRKDFFYVVVLILTFITFVVGMTFAIYYWVHSQEEGSSAVYTGTLYIEYTSGDVINLNKSIYPRTKPSFDATDNVYRNEFSITNTGNLNGIMKINIHTISNTFSDDVVKYILFNANGDELATGFLNGEMDRNIMDNLVINANSTENFVLSVWINETDNDQSYEMSKKLVGTILVDAVQVKE